MGRDAASQAWAGSLTIAILLTARRRQPVSASASRAPGPGPSAQTKGATVAGQCKAVHQEGPAIAETKRQ